MEKYDIEMNGTDAYQLKHAISSGTEEGIFALPKGPSGKVKLAPKVPKPDSATKEVRLRPCSTLLTLLIDNPLHRTLSLLHPRLPRRSTLPPRRLLLPQRHL